LAQGGLRAVPRSLILALVLLAAALLPAGCGAITPGGEFSGVPDTTVGDWRNPTGTISTSGVIRLNREQGL
jgi:hypothetical protein